MYLLRIRDLTWISVLRVNHARKVTCPWRIPTLQTHSSKSVIQWMETGANQKTVKKPNISKVGMESSIGRNWGLVGILNLGIWMWPKLSPAHFYLLLWWFHFLPLLPLHGECQTPLRLPHLSFSTKHEKLFIFSDHVWKTQVNDLFAEFDMCSLFDKLSVGQGQLKARRLTLWSHHQNE